MKGSKKGGLCPCLPDCASFNFQKDRCRSEHLPEISEERYKFKQSELGCFCVVLFRLSDAVQDLVRGIPPLGYGAGLGGAFCVQKSCCHFLIRLQLNVIVCALSNFASPFPLNAD